MQTTCIDSWRKNLTYPFGNAIYTEVCVLTLRCRTCKRAPFLVQNQCLPDFPSIHTTKIKRTNSVVYMCCQESRSYGNQTCKKLSLYGLKYEFQQDKTLKCDIDQYKTTHFHLHFNLNFQTDFLYVLDVKFLAALLEKCKETWTQLTYLFFLSFAASCGWLNRNMLVFPNKITSPAKRKSLTATYLRKPYWSSMLKACEEAVSGEFFYSVYFSTFHTLSHQYVRFFYVPLKSYVSRWRRQGQHLDVTHCDSVWGAKPQSSIQQSGTLVYWANWAALGDCYKTSEQNDNDMER